MSIPPVKPKDNSLALNPFFEKGSFLHGAMTSLASSPYKDVIKGIFSGAIEVAVDQPLVTFKNILQKRMRTVQNKSQHAPSIWKSLSLRQLYGGALVNGTGMSIIIGVQMGAIGWTKQKLAHGRNPESLSDLEKLFASIVGGLVAAPIASWSEMLMDKQRENVRRYEEQAKKGIRPTYWKATTELWQQYGRRTLTLGLIPTILREMPFTASYAAGGPYFAACLQKNDSFKFIASQQQIIPLNLIATIVGSAFAGALGATLTQPFDTWKTQCQGGMKTVFWPQGIRTIMKNSLQTSHQTGRVDQALGELFHHLLAEPYKGFGPRFTRVVSAVILLNLLSWSFEEHVKQYQ